MNSSRTADLQQGHIEMGPRFKVSSKKTEKQEIDFAIPGLVVQCVILFSRLSCQGFPFFSRTYVLKCVNIFGRKSMSNLCTVWGEKVIQ